MSFIEITGGRPLMGELMVQGSKNAVLPLLAAAVLNSGKSIINNCPRIQDVTNMLLLMERMGCRIFWKGRTLQIDASGLDNYEVTGPEVTKVRASVLFLGALAGRCGEAVIAYPGGCSIGERKIDFHLEALGRMGVHMEDENGVLSCRSEALRGSDIFLKFPSVGATQNVILAAALAKGTTHIYNAAAEPEIQILCEFLNKAGADIAGGGKDRITVRGVQGLSDVEYTLSGDRIVAGTYLAAAAGSRGKVRLTGARIGDLTSLVSVFRRMGADVYGDEQYVCLDARNRNLTGISLVTEPYPGFPTDMQSQMLSVMCGADSDSSIRETIFEKRFRTADELKKMGGRIAVVDSTAYVKGNTVLRGAFVSAYDLRGGAALVIAGLFAEGKTVVSDEKDYIKRGYEDIAGDLLLLGASVRTSATNQKRAAGTA